MKVFHGLQALTESLLVMILGINFSPGSRGWSEHITSVCRSQRVGCRGPGADAAFGLIT